MKITNLILRLQDISKKNNEQLKISLRDKIVTNHPANKHCANVSTV